MCGWCVYGWVGERLRGGRGLARKHPRVRGLLLFALTACIFRGRQASERHKLDRSQHLDARPSLQTGPSLQSRSLHGRLRCGHPPA